MLPGFAAISEEEDEDTLDGWRRDDSHDRTYAHMMKKLDELNGC